MANEWYTNQIDTDWGKNKEQNKKTAKFEICLVLANSRNGNKIVFYFVDIFYASSFKYGRQYYLTSKQIAFGWGRVSHVHHH